MCLKMKKIIWTTNLKMKIFPGTLKKSWMRHTLLWLIVREGLLRKENKSSIVMDDDLMRSYS